MSFKVLPDVKLAWGDVWVGAAATAVLFTAGKYLIGLYLGRASVASPFGAAGSLVVILVWVCYSSQILLLGAEFTRGYAKRFGTKPQVAESAVPRKDEACLRQGAPPRRQQAGIESFIS